MDTALHCPTCGYNLTGLPENRCPECGQGFEPEVLARRASPEGRRRENNRVVGRFMLICVGLSLLGLLLAPGGDYGPLFPYWLIGWLMAFLSAGVLTGLRVARLTTDSMSPSVWRLVWHVACVAVVLMGGLGVIYFTVLLSLLLMWVCGIKM